MSTCEHQGRDTVLLQTGAKIHWSRRSASFCFNRVWRVTKHSAKHQSMLNPWVMQHQPWPSKSAWTETRSLHAPASLPDSISRQIDFSRKKENLLLCSHNHTTVIAGPKCLNAHLLAPHDRGESRKLHWKLQHFNCEARYACDYIGAGGRDRGLH